jgi:hypothetical protein
MIWRLPIIRHIRWLWYRYWIARWVEAWGALIMNPRDQKRLEDIWAGHDEKAGRT